jgi:signal transduction histidine kinase
MDLSTHKIELTVEPSLPLVEGDPTLIDQALGQLLSNSVKYSPPGTPIRIDVRQTDRLIAISVTDQGAGLTAQEAKRWGERFYRGERSGQAIQGSGLGSWIAKEFVAANGGIIRIASAGLDRGTEVVILLPIPDNQPPLTEAQRDD